MDDLSTMDIEQGATSLICRVWTPAPRMTFLLGAQWRYAEDEGNAKIIMKAWQKEGFDPKGAKLRVMPNADGNWIVAAWHGRARYLAAPLMALIIRSGIFVQRLSDNEVWMLAASDGCVLPGHDLVTSPGRMAGILREWYSLLPDPTVYGDEAGSQRAAEDCWKALVDAIRGKDVDPGVLKYSTLSSPSVIPVVGGVAAVGLIAGIVIMALQVMRGPDVPPVVDLAALDSIRSAQEDLARQERLRQRFNEAVALGRAAHATPYGLAEAFDVVDTLRTMPFHSGGAHIMSIDCTREAGDETRSIWMCQPTWRNDLSAGLLYQAPLRSAPPEMGGAAEQGFLGSPLRITAEKQGGAFIQISPSEWWLHALHDQFLAAGIEVVVAGAQAGELGDLPPSESVVAMGAAQPITIQSGAFQEDGFALQGVPDATIGERADIRWATTLAQLESASWRDYWRQWPAQANKIRVDEKGVVTIDMAVTRLTPISGT